MSLYHPQSARVGVEVDDYSETITPTNADVIDNSIVYLRPVSSNVNDRKLTFRYEGDPYHYIDLGRTLMRLECQIVDEKDQIIPAPREVLTAPSFLTTVFQSRNVGINDKWFKTGELLPFMGHIRDVFTLRLPYKKTVANATNLYYDGEINYDETAHRFAMSNTKKFQVAGYLDMVPFEIGKPLPPGLRYQFDFYRSSDEFVLIDRAKYNPAAKKIVEELIKKEKGQPLQDENQLVVLNPKLKILSAEIQLICLKLNVTLNTELEKSLNSNNNLLYDFVRPEMYSFVVNAGLIKTQTPALSVGPMPQRMLVLLMKQSKYSGTYAANPFAFGFNDMSRIVLLRNGHTFSSSKEFNINFEPKHSYQINDDSVFVYTKLHDWLGQGVIESCGITLEQFKHSICAIPFDLTPALNASDLSATPLISEGDLSIQVEFSQPTTENLILLCYCEYKSSFEINRRKELFLNYGG